ncbi:hypothetical protein S1001342_02652 [Acetobacter pasteurianus subsp. pasteurianus]|uniref:Uncharacterized protein n=1 Tax=Acetobacter pasteurianus subsp. pasteurianus TaxID=481145 RepID=A0A1Y0Y168_ACEPA|nr:hypothetical protein S1001342_02652 [Acetobacter pasteurianus subsp. pasteurianus]
MTLEVLYRRVKSSFYSATLSPSYGGGRRFNLCRSHHNTCRVHKSCPVAGTLGAMYVQNPLGSLHILGGLGCR